jgi:DNA segregation ATPase FtsK/SpoIIIE-like protein
MSILGRARAERLLGRGDLLLQGTGSPVVRLQGYRA